MNVAISYTLFAVIATMANIGAQEVSLHLILGEYTVAISVLWGTLAGLIVKYWLDKQYIFRFQTRSLAHTGRSFVLYAVMGLLTTTVFWGFEWLFHILFESKAWRYFGGVIGLAIGYVIKYFLDKKYVFIYKQAVE
mgnify:CR=1 FL=1